MKLVLSILLLSACATTQTPPAKKTINDVRIGDNLPVTFNPILADCTLTVHNIATAAPTPIGVIPMKPTVCGPLFCSKGSIPEASTPIHVCMEFSKFQ